MRRINWTNWRREGSREAVIDGCFDSLVARRCAPRHDDGAVPSVGRRVRRGLTDPWACQWRSVYIVGSTL